MLCTRTDADCLQLYTKAYDLFKKKQDDCIKVVLKP